MTSPPKEALITLMEKIVGLDAEDRKYYLDLLNRKGMVIPVDNKGKIEASLFTILLFEAYPDLMNKQKTEQYEKNRAIVLEVSEEIGLAQVASLKNSKPS